MCAIVYSCNSTKSSDSIHEQTCCQDIATVCISNSQYLGFGGPWLSAVSALVCKNIKMYSLGEGQKNCNTSLTKDKGIY
jgi:hypothetical protein